MVAPKRARSGTGKKGSQPRRVRVFTDEDIALRAYFIAEQRHRTGAPGDETGDWVEAERQLRFEHGSARVKLPS